MNNSLVVDNFHLQTFIMITRKCKKMCVYILYINIYNIYLKYMCVYVHVFLYRYMHTDFLTTFTFLFIINDSTHCPFVTLCQNTFI